MDDLNKNILKVSQYENHQIITESKNELKKSFPNKNETNLEIENIANNILKYPTKSIKKINSAMEQKLFGNRIELNGYLGTIKYIGKLQHKNETNSELWLGIEWDDESRGKHNGLVENFKYFETKNNKNSGSLIKISKVNFGIDLEEALNFKYDFENKKNDLYAFMNNIVENELFIQANKKRIEIEFVGKEKAIKKYSDYRNFPSIDLGFSHLSNLCESKLKFTEMFPNLKELNLTRSLLCKWSDFAKIITNIKTLEGLNFSDNLLAFDPEFYEIKKDILQNNNYKNIKLKSLILNKNKLCLDDLFELSFLWTNLESLYLFDNQVNEKINSVELNNKNNVEELRNNLTNLKILSLEKNGISNMEKLLNYIPSHKLIFLNLSQNHIKYLFDKEKNKSNLTNNSKDYFSSLKVLNLDFNAISDYQLIFDQIKIFSNLEELNILNNAFVRNPKLGIENSKINLIGRLLKLIVLNHTTVSKEMKRDSELIYLKNSVKEYFDNLKENFNLEKFDEFMKENHPNYFILRKKYYDPVEDFLEGIKVENTNTIKGNILEFSFMNKNKILKKKFPKTTTFYNLKNLMSKLFKINSNFIFQIVTSSIVNPFNNVGYDKSNYNADEIYDITDESKTLEDFNISDKDLIVLV